MLPQLLLIALLAIPLALACDRSYSNPAQDGTKRFDESKEPPLRFTLRIGNKSIPITEGETARVNGTFSNPKVTLTAQPLRVFAYQGISFKYPRAFTFEADLSDSDYKNWTLSGNDFKVMYFILNDRLTTDAFAENLADQFGHQNCSVQKASPLKFDNKELYGTTLNATVVGNKMVMDIYRIPSAGAQTKLLVFQDNVNDSGNRSIEGKSTLQLIKQSSKLGP